ncbi:MAG: transglycosylase SLT domain-containing protein [Muribaculaceae bacterium]|nr:transglycosylase SLT domain-containing protein [Muribaculaceae bacterium]
MTTADDLDDIPSPPIPPCLNSLPTPNSKDMNRILLSTILAAAAFIPSYGAKHNVLDLKNTITDDAIVYPETFERDTQKLLEGWYLKNYTSTDDRYARSGDVETSDETIKRRLAAMPTIIEMPYNQIVRDYIKRYTGRGREQVAAILGLSLYYTPIFEQALEAAGLPLELKYLPVIESALDPNAVSRSGATGLWQLMIATANGLGLEVNSLVDERRDPYLSSEKAVQYLKDLYETYNDWSLAIAAYNCGPGAVNKALRRAGGDPKQHDFWSIYPYLSAETRGYVPMFIAANYVMTYYKDHNISPVLATKPLVTDTVAVRDRLHFNQISEVLNIPVEELRILNPQFRADVIPASSDHPYFLILPGQQIHAYLVSEKDIYAHEAEKYARRESVEPGDAPVVAYEAATSDAGNTPVVTQKEAPIEQKPASTDGLNAITHKVSSGETLASIAQQYNVDANDIKEWNNLRRNAVRSGQQLKIYAPAGQAVAANTRPKKEVKKEQPKAEQPKKGTKKETKEEQPKAELAKTDNKQATQTQQSVAKKDKKADTKNKQKAQNKKKEAKKKQPAQVEVKSGDSLTSIAKRNGTTVDELRKSNPNIKGDMLHPGDKLNLPSKNASGSKGKRGKSGSKKKGKKK